jgi:hypothetical protein
MMENKEQSCSAALSESICLDEHFVAAFYRVSLGTVRRWRYLGRGPRYRKLGSLVRYSLEDLQSWLASRPTGGEHPAEGKHE